MLDICLTLHAEHGGGNNSTFTTHVVTSSGTDTYSCMAAALASLKGPKHGGANIKVIRMFEDMKEQVKDWKDEDEVRHYLQALLDKQAFDKAGLIYGMGHAVYSLSDPRANLLHSFVEKLSREKGRTEEYELYSLVERLGPEIIAGERKMYKGVSANVDFYSGFVYHMLDLPWSSIPPLCHGPGGRMERPPYRGASSTGQNHPPGLQVCGEPRGLCAACGAVTSNPSERSVFGDEVYTGKGRA